MIPCLSVLQITLYVTNFRYFLFKIYLPEIKLTKFESTVCDHFPQANRLKHLTSAVRRRAPASATSPCCRRSRCRTATACTPRRAPPTRRPASRSARSPSTATTCTTAAATTPSTTASSPTATRAPPTTMTRPIPPTWAPGRRGSSKNYWLVSYC